MTTKIKPIKKYTINLAGIPNEGSLLIVDRPIKEYVLFEGVEPPIIDLKTKKIIKPGKLLNVKREI